MAADRFANADVVHNLTPARAAVVTPDFYEYVWSPLTMARLDGRFVEMAWADGTSLRAYSLWLREQAVGAGGVDPSTREGLMDPALLHDDVQIGDVAVTGDGALAIRWQPDAVDAIYHPGWLRHVAEGQHRPSSWLPEPVAWTAADRSEPPTHDGANILNDEQAFAAYLSDLVGYGLARLRNLPADLDFGLAFAKLIGPVRDSNFGPIWDVKADIPLEGASATNSTANTTRRLGPHTDLPTRETPPGYQFLHCVQNTTEGGYSTMADGAAVVDYIADHHPEHYEALTTLRWVFFNRGIGIDHRWSGPIIDQGVPGSPLTLRAFYPVKAFPDMDEADMPRAYAAAQCFSDVATDARFQISYPFEVGDMIGFDNRRILHGRDEYSAGGQRHLRGFYIDHDEILSRARVCARATSRLRAPSS